MLTAKYISKVARLLDQTGEPRPGFLHDGTANLSGESAISESVLAPKRKRAKQKKRSKSISITLVYEEDPRTGEPRLVQK